MSNIISAIQDFLGVVFLGVSVIFFLIELKIGIIQVYFNQKPKLSSYTNQMTRTYLDLSDERVYGKNSSAF